MTIKLPQTMIRVDPALRQALSIAAALEGKHNYEMAEELLLEGLRHTHPELYTRCLDTLGDQSPIKRKQAKREKNDRRQNLDRRNIAR